MKSTETTVGGITDKKTARYVAEKWNNPSQGYHAQYVKKGIGYIVRLVINA